MTKKEVTVEQIKTIIDMAENKEVRALAKIMLKFVQQQPDPEQPSLGFGRDKESQ